jgi:putative spermidine/putrescine transport system ATP-binding protein
MSDTQVDMSPSDEHFLQLTDLTLAYGHSIAVEKLNLTVGRGELIAFLGPSGCGKSTTMRAIAGLMKPASGSITLDNKNITRVPANKREVGLVFQSYALFPHLTVFENVAFGLRLKRSGSMPVATAVDSGLQTVGLVEFADRKPAELSGGQQQRVALARALVMDPKLLLLDEPLSNLDARLRLEMRAELQRVQRDTRLTMIFVTHDQAEALSLADRIVVMNNGSIEQVGTPETIYNQPATRFVADFVGFENIFAIDGSALVASFGTLTAAETLPKGAAGLAWRPATVVLGQGPYQGDVVGSSFAGNKREYLLDSALGKINAEVDASLSPFAVGDRIAFDLPITAAAELSRM